MNVGLWTSKGYLIILGVRYRMWRYPDLDSFVVISSTFEADTETILAKMTPKAVRTPRKRKES